MKTFNEYIFYFPHSFHFLHVTKCIIQQYYVCNDKVYMLIKFPDYQIDIVFDIILLKYPSLSTSN